MKFLLEEIRACQLCAKSLPHGPRPVLQASKKSKIAIIGQAPGAKVHKSGIAWKDPSGDLFPLPHPSPRNRYWLKHNPWFEEEVLPVLIEQVEEVV